eukprot:1161181-Pelagomonas_calceolata.AAC.10
MSQHIEQAFQAQPVSSLTSTQNYKYPSSRACLQTPLVLIALRSITKNQKQKRQQSYLAASIPERFWQGRQPTTKNGKNKGTAVPSFRRGKNKVCVVSIRSMACIIPILTLLLRNVVCVCICVCVCACARVKATIVQTPQLTPTPFFPDTKATPRLGLLLVPMP